MKKILIAILLLVPVSSYAKDRQPNSADYPLTVHVQSSIVVLSYDGVVCQQLTAIIDKKKYLLQAGRLNSVLPVGDYQARQSSNKVTADNEYNRKYEILFTDGSTRKYDVIGESE